jgi:hypothetical protein
MNNITLVSIDGVGKDDRHLKAIKYSLNNFNFKEVLYFSSKNWSDNSYYKFIEIPKLSYDEYNKFCLVELHKYINTDHVLLIQDDGFIINPNLWTDEFLNFDYIGAPWPKDHLFFNTRRWPFIHEKLIENNISYHIGNGGFTLRSKKLLEEVSKLYNKDYKDIPEDVLICIGFRKILEEKGFKFADLFYATQFSCESHFIEGKRYDTNSSFGFHGRETHAHHVSVLNNVQL